MAMGAGCQQGNGCRPAVAIDTLRLWAGGCGCSLPAGNGCSRERVQPASGGYRGAGGSVLVLYVCSSPAWNGCRVPAGAIDALRLWAGGYVCSRGKDAGQLVLSGC